MTDPVFVACLIIPTACAFPVVVGLAVREKREQRDAIKERDAKWKRDRAVIGNIEPDAHDLMEARAFALDHVDEMLFKMQQGESSNERFGFYRPVNETNPAA
jgi:hypothetical protein